VLFSYFYSVILQINHISVINDNVLKITMNKLWKPEAKNTDIFSAELFARNIKFYLKITELTVLDKKNIYILASTLVVRSPFL
jgi:hypothetical protein